MQQELLSPSRSLLNQEQYQELLLSLLPHYQPVGMIRELAIPQGDLTSVESLDLSQLPVGTVINLQDSENSHYHNWNLEIGEIDDSKDPSQREKVCYLKWGLMCLRFPITDLLSCKRVDSATAEIQYEVQSGKIETGDGWYLELPYFEEGKDDEGYLIAGPVKDHYRCAVDSVRVGRASESFEDYLVRIVIQFGEKEGWEEAGLLLRSFAYQGYPDEERETVKSKVQGFLKEKYGKTLM